MKITVLGCGTSGGVPSVGGGWGDCNPADPRNRRRRASILVEEKGTTLLVDTSPDVREQLLAARVRDVSAILYTHAHADHCHGIDDTRGLNRATGRSIPVFADATTLRELQERFAYAFQPPTPGFYRPALEPYVVDPAHGPFTIGTVTVTPFLQEHVREADASLDSLGFRFNDVAYTTDARNLAPEALALLKGIRVWIVDCLREKPHPTHAHLERTLGWIAQVRPEKAFLTHMDSSMDYATLAARLPPGVLPAHDGLVVEA